VERMTGIEPAFSAWGLYGPCHTCVAQLRNGQVLDQRDSVVADYVPKMNVTPNAVFPKE
jgi:hypothetical protein